jgi:hypothetical protein
VTRRTFKPRRTGRRFDVPFVDLWEFEIALDLPSMRVAVADAPLNASCAGPTKRQT